MKVSIYLLLFLIISLIGCNDNSTDPYDSILIESETIVQDFDFYRDSISNSDTLSFALESSNPDVYVFVNFYLAQRNISSYTTILQIDTPATTNVNFEVRQDYTEIDWTTAFEENNMGWEIQRKDSNQTYNTVGFVDGSGTSNETHEYSFRHNINLSELFFYRLKQIHFDATFEYSLEAKIEVEATDSIKANFSITADNGVIIYDGETAPDSGYSYNLSFDIGDLIYFKNSFFHYGKIKVYHFGFMNEPLLNIDESSKNISYQLSYEIFLQTNGTRTFF